MVRGTWLTSAALLVSTVFLLSLQDAAAKDKVRGGDRGSSASRSQRGSQPSSQGHSRSNFSGRSRGSDAARSANSNRGSEMRTFDARSFGSRDSASRQSEPRNLQPRSLQSGNLQPRNFDQNGRFQTNDGPSRRVQTFRPPTDRADQKPPTGKLMDGDLPGARSGSPKYPKYNPKDRGTVETQPPGRGQRGSGRADSSRNQKTDGGTFDRPKFERPTFDKPTFGNSATERDPHSRGSQSGPATRDRSGSGKVSRDHRPDRPNQFDRLPQGTRDALDKANFPQDLKLRPGNPASGNRQNLGRGSDKFDHRHRDPTDFDRERMKSGQHMRGPNLSGDQAKRDRYDMQRHRLGGDGPGHNHRVDAATAAKWSKQSWLEKSDRTHYGALVKNASFAPYHLDRQYRLHQHGDIARQLNLRQSFVQHGGWQHRHVGLVSSQFRNQCSFRNYWGPSWFPQRCWYPRWSPWVSWSWGFQCNPWFDPRPAFCRPMIYAPSQRWVFWQYPVWQPLPIVAAGTWVDVPQVLVDAGFDLRLLAVRFVDPGLPEQGLGQRYRVWIRNDSDRDLAQPFNVVVMGTNDLIPGKQRLEVGQRVPNLAAGQTLALDLRLPLSPEGMDEPMPFEKLHVLVDANRELNDVDMTNNGAVLDRGDTSPVDPAAFNVDADLAAAGQVITIAGEGLGPGPGKILLQVGNETYQPEILGWYDLGVQVRVPEVAAEGMVEGDLIAIRADGAAANPLALQIVGSQGGREF